jgi:predicted nucleic acid-binding protein
VILVDTSVWIDHLRQTDHELSRLLDQGLVLAHPFITGELALGNLQNRATILDALQSLPQATIATDTEVMHLIDHNALFGMGIGYVDAHLLAAVRLTIGSSIWTRDKRLNTASLKLNLATNTSH